MGADSGEQWRVVGVKNGGGGRGDCIVAVLTRSNCRRSFTTLKPSQDE